MADCDNISGLACSGRPKRLATFLVIWMLIPSTVITDGATSNPLRRRSRIRADDGSLEPDRRRDLSRLAGAAPRLAMDRRRLRQRCLYRAARGTMCASRGSGD